MCDFFLGLLHMLGDTGRGGSGSRETPLLSEEKAKVKAKVKVKAGRAGAGRFEQSDDGSKGKGVSPQYMDGRDTSTRAIDFSSLANSLADHGLLRSPSTSPSTSPIPSGSPPASTSPIPSGVH